MEPFSPPHRLAAPGIALNDIPKDPMKIYKDTKWDSHLSKENKAIKDKDTLF